MQRVVLCIVAMLNTARLATAFTARGGALGGAAFGSKAQNLPTRSKVVAKSVKIGSDSLPSLAAELSGGAFRTITDSEKQVIQERQLRHSSSALIGVPAATKCQHGFPQAGLWTPIGHHVSTGWKPVSGLCRLTCPYLVKAIDEYEAEGAVVAFNERLRSGDSTIEGRTWPLALDKANEAHKNLRRSMMSDEEVKLVRERLGAKHEDAFMQSGVAGTSPDKLDVKCLHAQLGDYLLRGDNAVGETVARDLERRGVSLGGCVSCRQQCDVAVPEEEGGWNYVSVKNKSKLRTRSERRTIQEALKKLPSKRRAVPPRRQPYDSGGTHHNGGAGA